MAITINHQTNELSATSGPLIVGPPVAPIAAENISTLSPAVIRGDGMAETVKASVANALGLSSSTGYTIATGNQYALSSAFDPTTGLYVVAWYGSTLNGTNACVVRLSGSTVNTLSTPVLLQNNTRQIIKLLFYPKIGRVLCFESDGSTVYMRILTVNGASNTVSSFTGANGITIGTPASGVGLVDACVEPNTGMVAVSYGFSSGATIYTRLVDISSALVTTVYSEQTIATGYSSGLSVAASTASKKLVYSYSHTSGNSYYVVATFTSPTSVSLGVATSIGALNYPSVVYHPLQNVFVFTGYTSGATIRAASLSGTVLTFGADVILIPTLISNTPFYSTSYDPVSDKIIVAFSRNGGTYTNGYYAEATIAGTTCTAGVNGIFESLTRFGQVSPFSSPLLVCSRNGNVSVSAYVPSRGANTSEAAGITTASATIGATTQMAFNGGVVTGLSSIVAGQKYYVNSSGELVTSGTTQVGKGISAGSIFIETTQAAAGSLSLIANSNISSGAPAILRSDGQIEPPNASFSAPSAGFTAGAIDEVPLMVPIDSSKFAVVFGAGTTLGVVIGSFSGGVVTYGSVYTRATTWSSRMAATYDPVTAKLLIYYLTGGSTPNLLTLNVSGTTVTLSGNLFMSSGDRPAATTHVGLVYDTVAASPMMFYANANNSNFATATLVSTASANPALGTSTVISSVSSATGLNCFATFGNGRVLFGYATTSTSVTFNGGSWNGSSYTIGTPTVTVTAYNDYGLVYCGNNQFAWTYLSNTGTLVRVYSITLSSNTPTLNLTVTVSSNFQYLSSTPSRSQQGRTWYDSATGMVSNVWADVGLSTTAIKQVLISRVSINSSGGLTLNSPVQYATGSTSIGAAYLCCGGIYLSSAGKSVFINNGFDYPTSVTSRFVQLNLAPNGAAYLGISSESYTTGQTAVITTIGGVSTTLSGLTTGVKYFCDCNGYPIPDRLLGFNGTYGSALSSTSLYIRG